MLARGYLAIVLLLFASPSLAGHVWWQERDGSTTGSFTDATWADLQTAITSAQGGGSATTGLVKISGDITRTNSAWNQLSVSAGGNVVISGGWNWPGGESEPTVQSGRSTLNMNAYNGFNDAKRVLYINAPLVTLDAAVLTRGREHEGGGVYLGTSSQDATLTNVVLTSNYIWQYGNGGGLYASGFAGLRITGCVVSNNLQGSDGNAMCPGIYLQSMGSADRPAVIEHCLIQNNRDSGGRGNAGALFCSSSPNVLVANCRIIGNASSWASYGYPTGASAILLDGTARVTVFGSLIQGNLSSTTDPSQLAMHQQAHGNGLTLANSTILDNNNGNGGWYVMPATSPDTNVILRLINCVLRDKTMSLRYNAGGRAHVWLQNTTCNITNYAASSSTGTTNWTNLSDAIQQPDGDGRHRFHSLDAANQLSQAIEGNIDGTVQFAGTAPHPYALQSTNPNAIGNGLSRDGGGFAYVDINLNGAYNALVDVIVDGAPPAIGSHFVYRSDLAGNPRKKSVSIDRGAYESQVSKGTVVTFR